MAKKRFEIREVTHYDVVDLEQPDENNPAGYVVHLNTRDKEQAKALQAELEAHFKALAKAE